MVCSGPVILKLPQHFILKKNTLDSAVVIQANQKTKAVSLLIDIDVTQSIIN